MHWVKDSTWGILELKCLSSSQAQMAVSHANRARLDGHLFCVARPRLTLKDLSAAKNLSLFGMSSLCIHHVSFHPIFPTRLISSLAIIQYFVTKDLFCVHNASTIDSTRRWDVIVLTAN